MSAEAGVLRTSQGLHRAAAKLAELAGRESTQSRVPPRIENWEATDLLTVAAALVNAAAARQETRGSHWREDFPDRDDPNWRGHLITRLVDGRLTSAYEPVT
jgi:L-aspartate oxidase